MWLIDTKTFDLQYHTNCPISQYAILSHTWEDDEVGFQDFKHLSSAREKKGFSKIEWTVLEARRRRLKWAWVDTCCINKDSSAELSEAINSMFQWYKDSAVCFAYLSDLPTAASVAALFPRAPPTRINEVLDGDFRASRWWTRGWTLQELIAPTHVVFYGQGWDRYGSKAGLHAQITSITNISEGILTHESDLNEETIACRMSWAASRETTRVEDTAYCLLGIFGINMPLLYGEGQKAFIRLQVSIWSYYFIRMVCVDEQMMGCVALLFLSNWYPQPSRDI